MTSVTLEPCFRAVSMDFLGYVDSPSRSRRGQQGQRLAEPEVEDRRKITQYRRRCRVKGLQMREGEYNVQ